MSFKKNFRGAETYAMPATEKYRNEYDRIFRTKPPEAEATAVERLQCAHEWVRMPCDDNYYCAKCDAKCSLRDYMRARAET